MPLQCPNALNITANTVDSLQPMLEEIFTFSSPRKFVNCYEQYLRFVSLHVPYSIPGWLYNYFVQYQKIVCQL
jgi:hypothetical protein